MMQLTRAFIGLASPPMVDYILGIFYHAGAGNSMLLCIAIDTVSFQQVSWKMWIVPV